MRHDHDFSVAYPLWTKKTHVWVGNRETSSLAFIRNTTETWWRIKLQYTVRWGTTPGGGGILPSNRLMGMCRWMGSHFHSWIDYNGVAFSLELLEWGRTFSDFWCKKVTIHGTRHDSQRRFLAQHSVAMLEQCWNHSKQCRNNIVVANSSV